MMSLVHLAREYDKGPTPISEIAEQEMIPQRFLEGILLHLKSIGVVNSVRGKQGGYFLIKKPSEVTLASVITEFEGTMGMLACVCSHSYKPCEFCKDETMCKIRRTFKYVHDSTAAILNTTTLADLI